MEFYIVDAFTSEPFGGNPAGVVLLEQGHPFPADKLMQQVAAELRYSETAFVRAEGNSTFTLRYFTPCGEVDLCGHATIASFGVLLHEGAVSEGETCLIHTLAGVSPAEHKGLPGIADIIFNLRHFGLIPWADAQPF